MAFIPGEKPSCNISAGASRRTLYATEQPREALGWSPGWYFIFKEHIHNDGTETVYLSFVVFNLQPLVNLKKLILDSSYRLKEIPNLSNVTNLETLSLSSCSSLVELPSSIRNLHKLEKLIMRSCKKLRVIPTNINLASLEEVHMSYC